MSRPTNVPGIKEFLSKAALNHHLTTLIGVKRSTDQAFHGAPKRETIIYIKESTEGTSFRRVTELRPMDLRHH